ncbi:amino acid adenylation domain-containing protein, partial [Pyxidicoccus fallax]
RVVDLTPLPEEQRQAEARRVVSEDAARPFDLAKGPLLRVTLVRLSERQHALLLNMHHIISDGWSSGVLVREMAALYEASSAGRPSPLPELAVQYADYAVWQRSWLQGEALDEQLGWWKQQLAGAPAYLELPTDKTRPPVLAHRGSSVDVRLPRELSESLKALAQREGATPFMLLLAGFQLLLSRYSGQDDVVVGSPIAGRRHAETEGLIGFFVNTLVLRAQLDARASFRDLLARVRESTLGAYEHQDVPFERLVEELQPARDLGRSPLFQAFFALQNTPAQELALPSLSLRSMDMEDIAVARFELALDMMETPDGFAGRLQFDTDLFTEATARRLMTHLQSLLEGVAARPEAPLAELSLLTPGERQQVLHTWNGSANAEPPDSTFHHLFERQAALTPDAPAVRHEEDVLSFARLNARANQLAHHLRSLGVGLDTPVALCLERSVDLIVAMLGVMKAGGAYVPLDPAWPAQRLGFTLQDCAAPVLVTRQRLADAWQPSGTRVLCLDTEAALLASRPVSNPSPTASADNLAYIIYTSGSTGTPKGVMVQHRSVLELHRSFAQAFYGGQPSGLHVSVNVPLVFDASVQQLIQVLDGHCLCIVPEATRQDAEALLKWIERNRIDALEGTPSMLRLLLQQGLLDGDAAPRLLFSGGEAVDEAAWKAFSSAPRTRTFNVYGPTECTVVATASRVTADTRPNIGGPLPHVRAYVLDVYGQPAPMGVPGELCISGTGLARGYLSRPELTAERFVPNPFSDTPGARMYRTGDKVRWLADGTLEYLGRIDFQVKVRGFRIELGEIETALAQHPAIRQAVVMAREDVPGDKRLVAWFTTHGRAPEPEALRAFLKERLPEYMVPSAFVPLEALPLTVNGKLDRRALPAPDDSAFAVTYVAPATATEERLAAVWAEVLRVPRVGRLDDFFSLGGHSLVATQVMARVRSTFGVELPLRALFEAPTLEALARRVDRAIAMGQVGGLSAPPLRPAPRGEGGVPLSFAQQRLWFLDQLQPGSPTYNMPVPLRLEGALDVGALERAFTELVRRHESLRTTFREEGGSPVQHIAPPAPFRLAVVDLSTREDREAEAYRLATAEAQRGFDLKAGPLLRGTLLRLEASRHVLLLTMHHIITDGWSLGVLVQEMAALYQACVAGKPSPLPELALQYADFAAWQRSWLQGEALEQQLDYWKQQLSGAPQVLELATDFPRPAVQTFRGALAQVKFPTSLSRALQAFCQKENVTPFMALLGAFQAFLARYSGQENLVVGSPIAGRRFVETEGLIGFFVNTLVLRARMEANPSFRELLAHVRDATLGAYAHQDIPFEKLVESLATTRGLDRSPLFQVFFALQNTPVPSVSGEALSIHPFELDSPAAKFDLELNLSESPEGLAGALIYNADLFLPETAARIARLYVGFLETLLERPEQPFHALPLLPTEELRSVLEDWNRSPSEFPRDATMPEVFSRVVSAHSDSVALEFGDRRLTYSQLDAEANRLAHLLVSRGVRPDAPVALALERSVELIVSLLAILKAGGAYLPLDTSYPRERLEQMIEDAQPVLLLTASSLKDAIPSGDSLPVVLVDSVDTSTLPSHSPSVALAPEHLAYIDFTSGSTGRPKGVAVSHRNVLRTVLNAPYADVSAGHSFLLIAPISFDASTLEVWGPLLNGARLVVFPPSSPSDLDVLSSVLQHHSVSTLHLTAGLFSQMVETHVHGLKSVKQLLTGGDVVSAPHVKRVLGELGIPVTACYGPTEGTLFTSTFRMTNAAQVPTSIPIGTPITGTQVYLLDSHLLPVAPGTPGELFIGGEGLARGYVRRPDLTAERFIPNPFSSSPGARMYRTGDLARWRQDGVLEFLGRKDFQVKVRGFRIELAEVEAALLAFPGVREAVALAREDAPGDKRLVGYVTGDASLDMSALREALKARLPEYMVPSALMRLDAFPLTANAKVDRKALPAPEARAEMRPFVAPRTATEQQLASVWAEVLRIDKVGLHDDFFELGGHSLLATQVVARIRATFGVELPLRALFASSTLEGLARAIDSSERRAANVPPLRAAPRGEHLPLSFAQQRLWFLDQLEPGSAQYNIPTALLLDGALDVDALRRGFEELVRRHESLRTTFRAEAGQPSQVIH